MHKAIAIYYSSSEILQMWNKISVNSCANKNVLLFEFCFSVHTCEISCFTYCIPEGMVSRDSTVEGDWLNLGDRCTRYRSIPYAVTKIAKLLGGGKYVPGEQRTAQGKEFKSILTVKMETRPLSREFSAFAIIAELWRPKVTRPGNFVSNFCVFVEKQPLMVKCSKFSSKS